MELILNLDKLKAVNEVFKRLNVLRRWTGFSADRKYNELSKQAFNNIVCYILACYAEENGIAIKWERFPKIALYRAFQKVYVYFDTPEYIINDICHISGIQHDCFNKVTLDIIAEETDDNFVNFLSEGLGTDEMKIYRAATKIATLVELTDIKHSGEEFSSRFQDIYSDIDSLSYIPKLKEISNTRGDLFKMLKVLSTLRNRTRWAAHCCTVDCSVLGHLFDTGVFAYFMSLENNPGDELLATRMYFMGIFHDLAETWTNDIPSPIKDRIPGFRIATEAYESKMVKCGLYAHVTKFVADKLKSVMIEEESNIQYKKLIKGADYLSADSECWRQFQAGSRDSYFAKAITNRLEKLNTGEGFITPVCKELYYYFFDYAAGLNLI